MNTSKTKIKRIKTNKILIIFSIVLMILAVGCGKKNQKKELTEKKLPLVKVKDITGETFTEIYKVVGTVKPYASAKLSSEEGGLITYLRKDKGSSVGRGEVVVRLKKDVDEAAYQQALSQYNMAKENYERAEKLFNDKVATEQQFTNAKLQLDIALKSINLYQVRLSKGYIISPISGVVEAKLMNLGEMTGPGVPIISVIDVSRVKINAGIPERYLSELSVGKNVKITFDALPDEEFNGKINYVSPAINSLSRTFDIEIVVDNRHKKLKPEMSANIFIIRNEQDNAVVLERDLIVDNGNEQFVFVFENEIAKKRIVSLGGSTDNKVLVTVGLNIGDKLINYGFRTLVDGDKVKVVTD